MAHYTPEEQAVIDAAAAIQQWEIQYQDPDSREWRQAREYGEPEELVGHIRGRKEADAKREALAQEFKHHRFRVVSVDGADKYREGISVGRELGPEPGEEEEESIGRRLAPYIGLSDRD